MIHFSKFSPTQIFSRVLVLVESKDSLWKYTDCNIYIFQHEIKIEASYI